MIERLRLWQRLVGEVALGAALWGERLRLAWALAAPTGRRAEP